MNATLFEEILERIIEHNRLMPTPQLVECALKICTDTYTCLMLYKFVYAIISKLIDTPQVNTKYC